MELRDTSDFENKIYAKGSVAALLRRDLRKAPREQTIAIGTATDPYQPAERRFKRTRQLLEVFAEDRGRSLSITTKSDLVTRDIDLLSAISKRNRLTVNMTVTTTDVDLARLLEPRAPRPDLRLKAVARLRSEGIAAGVFANPIMPFITDTCRNLENLAAAAKDARALYLGGGVLFLMPCAQKAFFPFLQEQFPHLLERYQQWFSKSAYLRGTYLADIKCLVDRIRKNYGLLSAPVDYQAELEHTGEQIPLFTAEAPSFPIAIAGPSRAHGSLRRVGTCA
jgi:DNA repair photolyase